MRGLEGCESGPACPKAPPSASATVEALPARLGDAFRAFAVAEPPGLAVEPERDDGLGGRQPPGLVGPPFAKESEAGRNEPLAPCALERNRATAVVWAYPPGRHRGPWRCRSSSRCPHIAASRGAGCPPRGLQVGRRHPPSGKITRDVGSTEERASLVQPQPLRWSSAPGCRSSGGDREREGAPRRVPVEEERGERRGGRPIVAPVDSPNPPSGHCRRATHRRAALAAGERARRGVGSTSAAPRRRGGKPPSRRAPRCARR